MAARDGAMSRDGGSKQAPNRIRPLGSLLAKLKLRRGPPLATVAAVAIAAGLYFSGWLDTIESEWTDLRYRLFERPAATTDVVLVELDKRSLHELGVWPWPRSLHAKLIDNLVAAGATRIAFDIDVSSASKAEQDRQFEQSLARAGDIVILPAFLQREASGEDQRVVVSQPLPQFSRHTDIASINVMPSDDGLVRRTSRAQPWVDGTTMRSMAAELAGYEGDDTTELYVDFGITASSIPTISYLDVATGQFDATVVAGRKIIVSATAVELGDMVPVPNLRSMPGGLFQALAYQSLIQDRALSPVHPAIISSATVCLMIGACLLFWGRTWRRSLLVASTGTAIVLVISGGVYLLFPVLLPATPFILGLWLIFVASLVRRVDFQSFQILVQSARLRRSETTMFHVVENSFGGILTFGEDGRIETANAAAGRIFGYERAELVGLPLTALFPGVEICLSDVSGHHLVTRGLNEIEGRRKDSRAFPVELALSDMAIDGRVSYIAVLQDISERKRQEALLLDAKRRAEEADNMKSTFLAQMSHELRTPLNAVIGFSEIIAGEMFGPVGAIQYKEYASDIHSSGKHLLNIVNDILDLSKLQAGKYELQESEIEISSVIDAALMLIGHPSRTSQDLHLDVPADLPRVRADERAVTQILVNLLSNAAKFTARDGSIRVSVACGAGGALGITVRDTGIGMRPEDIPVALTPFRQIDSRIARNYEGTGLGLPIVAALMRLHSGELRIESEPGRGTSVTIMFPAERRVPKVLALAPDCGVGKMTALPSTASIELGPRSAALTLSG